jgi:hypothetical protein
MQKTGPRITFSWQQRMGLDLPKAIADGLAFVVNRLSASARAHMSFQRRAEQNQARRVVKSMRRRQRSP